MFKNLNAGAIGIRNLPLADTIALAQTTSFAGIDFDIREAAALVDAHGIDYVRDLFARAGVRAGLWGLPVAWNQDRWQEDLVELPKLAALGVALGCSRTATWCPSWSDSQAYTENFQWHIDRYSPIAEILRDQGCRLGIEFLGPRHLWASHPHRFISSMSEMMALTRDIGTGNVGLLLDAYHLYTAGDEVDALDTLTANDVVVVHINDAPAGIPREEQADLVRCLPLESGVIDLVGFMQRLAALGYDGPVTTEPFSQRLNAIAAETPQAAAREVSQAMDRLWQLSGL
jgi:sugar phosphate isomerase/epimerase